MPKLSAPPVQKKIDIESVNEGIITLKNGSLRAVLMTTAVNFSLKSSEEQDALIFQYQGFLNSLDFPVQILVVSRRLDISNYLTLLEQKRKEQENELLKIQASEYMDFIKSLTQVSQIMSQSFYVVVPIAQTEEKKENLLNKISGMLSAQSVKKEVKSTNELVGQLWQRINFIIATMTAIGIKATVLNTQEVTELFYHLYNMDLKDKPTMTLGG